MINREQLEGYVDAGIALLDEKCAFKDWRGKVDLERLNVRSSSDCILGQIYGCYGEGLHDLSFSKSSYLYGFISGFMHWGLEEEKEVEEILEEIWREKLCQS